MNTTEKVGVSKMENGDTISRQAAIDALAKYIYNVYKVMEGKTLPAEDCRNAAESVIGELPSAQPNHNAEVSKMEIVCCENCEHWDTSWETACGSHYCPVIDMGTEKNFFCKYGAEKRGEADGTD